MSDGELQARLSPSVHAEAGGVEMNSEQPPGLWGRVPGPTWAVSSHLIGAFVLASVWESGGVRRCLAGHPGLW